MNSLCRALSHCSKRTQPHFLPSFMIYYSTKQPHAVSPSPPTSPSLTPEALKEVAAEYVSDSLRSTEIPFQPKVANLVNFIGVVRSPVRFLVSHDGKYWAGTIISQESPSSLPLSYAFRLILYYALNFVLIVESFIAGEIGLSITSL